jgi:hypothetical protein
MPGRSRIWRVVVPIVLIAAVLVMTVGVVCHTHTDCSPSTCPICHLVIAPTAAGAPSNVFVLIGEKPEPQIARLFFSFARRQIPARAPPA